MHFAVHSLPPQQGVEQPRMSSSNWSLPRCLYKTASLLLQFVRLLEREGSAPLLLLLLLLLSSLLLLPLSPTGEAAAAAAAAAAASSSSCFRFEVLELERKASRVVVSSLVEGVVDGGGGGGCVVSGRVGVKSAVQECIFDLEPSSLAWVTMRFSVVFPPSDQSMSSTIDVLLTPSSTSTSVFMSTSIAGAPNPEKENPHPSWSWELSVCSSGFGLVFRSDSARSFQERPKPKEGSSSNLIMFEGCREGCVTGVDLGIRDLSSARQPPTEAAKRRMYPVLRRFRDDENSRRQRGLLLLLFMQLFMLLSGEDGGGGAERLHIDVVAAVDDNAGVATSAAPAVAAAAAAVMSASLAQGFSSLSASSPSSFSRGASSLHGPETLSKLSSSVLCAFSMVAGRSDRETEVGCGKGFNTFGKFVN